MQTPLSNGSSIYLPLETLRDKFSDLNSKRLKNVPFEEGTYHGYGIHHFLRADPRFAQDPLHADDELRSLVDAAHQLGLYVILDIVLNHTGNVFAY